MCAWVWTRIWTRRLSEIPPAVARRLSVGGNGGLKHTYALWSEISTATSKTAISTLCVWTRLTEQSAHVLMSYTASPAFYSSPKNFCVSQNVQSSKTFWIIYENTSKRMCLFGCFIILNSCLQGTSWLINDETFKPLCMMSHMRRRRRMFGTNHS